ncbi:TPA: hypothetical protein QEM47_000391 [Pseudomonas putida]|uniref:hypothetical protein n=1 Tax=Pseudomonas putida TaxID=303 RepID=UPI00204C5D33|nr:hypothetical protein [Pseudomonas putida]MDD2116976.1 hypothetical protein [Pseudomonas putida]UPU90716.1 hypothetical protein M0766_17590 [Pseudomonas putida]HDS1727679.1 hypothetical protein [Pseudomonas putida]
MPGKQHPLDVRSVGEDTYICMSKGHHNLEEFMKAAVADHPGWCLGGPEHVWIKTTPGHGTYDCMYNIVPQGTRGAWPATYCWEFGEDYKRYNAEVQP